MKTTLFVHASTSQHVIEYARQDYGKQLRLRKKTYVKKWVLTLKATCLTLFFLSYSS